MSLKGEVTLTAVLLLVACSSEPPDAGPARDASVQDADLQEPDAGPDAGTNGPVVQVGVGQDRFNRLMGSEIVELVAGPQGGGRFMGHHIWSAVRTVGFNTDERVFVTFSVTSTNGDARATLPLQAPLLPDGSGGHIWFGINPRIDDCCLIVGRPILMRAEVEDVDGLKGSDEVEVIASRCPVVGPSACP